jgi:fermentation-respiration switch protein FrsA (DUF1100 family)
MRWIADNGGSAVPEDGPPAPVFLAWYGVPLADPQWQRDMQADSPLANLAGLRTPIYLWAGAKDDRVPLQAISRYAGEAHRRHYPITLLIDPQSGHNPGTERQREAVLYLVEAAAHRHLGGRLQPPSAALTQVLRGAVRLDTNQLSSIDAD